MYFLCILLAIICDLSTLALSEPPDSKLRVTNVYACESQSEDDTSQIWITEMVLDNVDSNEHKSFSCEVILHFDLHEDTNLTYVLIVDKNDNGDWQEDLWHSDGNLLEHVEKYIPEIWSKISDALEPKLKARWEAKGDITYKLNPIEILKGDFKPFGKMNGFFKMTAKIFNRSGKQIYCGIIEIQAD